MIIFRVDLAVSHSFPSSKWIHYRVLPFEAIFFLCKKRISSVFYIICCWCWGLIPSLKCQSIYVCLIPGKKNKKRRIPKNFTCSPRQFFLWFWAGFDNFISFFAALHCFRPCNDGNQLPGLSTFSSYGMYNICNTNWSKEYPHYNICLKFSIRIRNFSTRMTHFLLMRIDYLQRC